VNAEVDFMGRLDGKVALVTGGSRGIGLAVAEAASREGASLILAAREPKALEFAEEAVPGSRTFAADVTDPQQVERLFRHIRKEHGRLDVLVNSAGVFTFKPFARTRLDEWRANLDTNLTALFLVVKAALPLLARSRAPHIVNVLSVSSVRAFANCSAYCASKFGALGFTRVLAEELRPKKVRVTAVLPGSTNTRMMRQFGFPVDRAELVQPEDVAEAVLAALVQPSRTTIEEILVTPSRGAL
jgi:NAD(P)-dependent dehydrogenase (short-subunit alcohol dehydrogenase family)